MALQRIMQVFLLLAAMTFVFLGIFGVVVADMGMNADGTMGMGCPFMQEQAVICTMDLLQHIAAWKNALASIPQQTMLLSALLLYAAFALSFLYQLSLHDRTTDRIRFRHGDRSVRTSALQELFSNGILHPKVF